MAEVEIEYMKNEMAKAVQFARRRSNVRKGMS